jgi:IMP dehydrogenase/GMP reductase
MAIAMAEAGGMGFLHYNMAVRQSNAFFTSLTYDSS